MGITAGLNLAGWQLRHNGQWQWQDTPAENQSKSSYEETSTFYSEHSLNIAAF